MKRKDIDNYGEMTEHNSLLFIMVLFRIQEYLDTWKTVQMIYVILVFIL